LEELETRIKLLLEDIAKEKENHENDIEAQGSGGVDFRGLGGDLDDIDDLIGG